MQKPTVLVLGASGRIGAILRKCWSFEQVIWQARGKPGPGWVDIDPLSQPGALARAACGCSAILCLAGVVPGRLGPGRLGPGRLGPGRLGPGGNLGDNITLAEAAVRAGAVSGAAVFLASSAAVYGNPADNPAGVLKENAALNPVSDYGRAKADMEARGAALGSELGVRVCALRIANIAGIDAILGGWKPGFRLDQFPDGRTPRRSYIGVQTLARVLGDLMQATDLPDALNIASPGTVEMGALLEAAGLAWTPRVAPKEAIAKVCLSTQALERFTTLPETSPDALVAQWRAQKRTQKRTQRRQ